MAISAPLITVAPRPNGRILLHALAAGNGHVGRFAWPVESGREIHFLSRAAWGLAAVAGCLAEDRRRPPVFWFPGYFCNQSLGPLRRKAVEIRFYPVTDDATPDWAACRAMLSEVPPPDAFVLVYTFGFPSEMAEARRFADETGAWLIEDGAHVPAPFPGLGESGDVLLLSPYKWLPVPRAGLMLAKESDMRAKLARQVAALGAAYPSPWPWLARRIVEAAMPMVLKRRLLGARGQTEFDADPEDEGVDATPAIDPVSRRLLVGRSDALEKAADMRRRNAAFLAGYAWPDGCVAFREPRTDQCTPYRFVLRCPDHGEALRLFARLREAGIPAESWPDLPPEVLADAVGQAVAVRLRRTLLLLPVHQDLTPEILGQALARL